jgi:predicted heme/steroid binding protein/uncharacterized membrane protein
MKEFDLESLAGCNGKDGQPVYIAHKGKVYDVSASKLWKTGMHMKRHPAGTDLSTDIGAAPHGPEVLERFPQVGTVKEQEAGESLPAPLEALLEKIPFLRRHPHPMLVHFPIVFMISPLLFCLLSLATGVEAFETTAFHCLGAGVLFSIPGILSGFMTWWLNYGAKRMAAITIKIVLSFLMFATAVAAFLWRAFTPDLVASHNSGSSGYVLLLLSLMVMVSVIGWNGAGLTFPMEKE